MHALWRGALTAPLLVLAAGPATDLMAQAPAAEPARPSFRDTRRLEPGQPAQPALPAAPAVPASPPVAPQKALPSAAPFAVHPASTDKTGPEKGTADKAGAEKPGPEKTAPDKTPAPVKASATPARPLWLKQLATGACGVPSLTGKPLPSGRMQVAFTSACRARELVTWRYGGAQRQAKLDAEGRIELAVEGFAGTTTPIEIALADGTRIELPFEAENLGGVTKVALIWRGPMDLDLHAFENAAAPGKAGHVWPGAASSAVDAGRTAAQGPRGAGFLSASTTAGDGDQVEVFTFVHAAREGPGHIAFAVNRNLVAAKPAEAKPAEPAPVDGKTESTTSEAAKPDATAAATSACNPAALAEVTFRLIVAVPGQPPVTSRGIVAAADCGGAPAAASTFDTTLLPALRLGSR